MRARPSFTGVSGLVLALVLARSAVAAQEVSSAPDEAMEAGVEADAASLYLFRGLVYSDGPVTQSMAWVTKGALSLYAWTNVVVSAAPGARNLDEVDVGASYAIEQGDLTVTPALDLYLYRLSDAERAEGAHGHTAEVSLAVSHTRDGTTLMTKHVVDAASYRGAYFGEIGVSHARPLTPRTELAVAVSAGWASARFNRAYIGPERAGLVLVRAGVSITRRIGRHLYLRPHVELAVLPDPRLRASLARPTNGSVGLAVGVVR
jgi:hypothetical protein